VDISIGIQAIPKTVAQYLGTALGMAASQYRPNNR
jgi:hypothetical protein